MISFGASALQGRLREFDRLCRASVAKSHSTCTFYLLGLAQCERLKVEKVVKS
jgi:hypothetical protein